MTYNYSKLAGRIVEKCGSRVNFASKMNWSENILSQKMNNKSGWSQKNIEQAAAVLDIDPSEIGAYFFTKKY